MFHLGSQKRQVEIKDIVATYNEKILSGQLFFIVCVIAVVALARRLMRDIDLARLTWARAIPPYVIGSLAAFWTIQRLAAF